MSDPMRPRASLRTAVVWEVLKDALDRRVKATGRDVLDVLDTGGGSGNFAVPAARLGHRVTVVDPSPNALFALERRAAEAGVADRVRGVQGDAHGLFDVVDRAGHDAVLCHGVLEYVDDPGEAVRNAVAALRPGGVLSLLAAGLGGAVLARALAGHFKEARRALDDPNGRWGRPTPSRTASPPNSSPRWPGTRGCAWPRCTACASSPTSSPGCWWTPNRAPWRPCSRWRRRRPSTPPSTPWPPSSTFWVFWVFPMFPRSREGRTGPERTPVPPR